MASVIVYRTRRNHQKLLPAFVKAFENSSFENNINAWAISFYPSNSKRLCKSCWSAASKIPCLWSYLNVPILFSLSTMPVCLHVGLVLGFHKPCHWPAGIPMCLTREATRSASLFDRLFNEKLPCVISLFQNYLPLCPFRFIWPAIGNLSLLVGIMVF